MNILIADDDPMSLMLVGHMLEQDGHHVQTVNDGWGVLQAIESMHFDLIISDVFMPQISGLLLGNLVKQFYPITVPILLMSSKMTNELVVAALKVGACGFLAKPVNRDELRRALGDLQAGKTASA